jgi:hypothetical protein
MQLVEGFIDYVPGKDFSAVMADHRLDVPLEYLGELGGFELALR